MTNYVIAIIIILVRQGRKPFTKGSEAMEEMANAAETIEKLAREAERLQLLEVARGCKDLDEFIKKLETAIKSN